MSIDSQFVHHAYRETPVQKGGIGPVQFTLVADVTHAICQAYGVEHPVAGVAFRGAFIIDKKGVVRVQIVNDLPVGRNIDEILRLIDAIDFVDTHGEVCPAGWQRGQAAMKASPEGVAAYLSAYEADAKQVLILNTAALLAVSDALGCARWYVETILSMLSALKHPELPQYHFYECEPLLDSSNMSTDNWNQLAEIIATHRDRMDGFVILHGTDTLAYTASALSFMLENLDKPVIVTGSQLPLTALRTDAIDNIVTALLLGATPALREVCVFILISGYCEEIVRENSTRIV